MLYEVVESTVAVFLFLYSYAVSSKIEPFYKGGKVQVGARLWCVCVCLSVCEASINVFCDTLDTFVTMRWYKVERIAQGIQEVQQNQESPDFVSW